ncbi:YihY/virulence factor BrkB family protein [Variovorax sp. PAMC 28711]|uniref:YihY/virulence factor BrkB family protein n=1 Tax=Variovorax sp. PAMC 28711 TaxID=1795631 RepID=UPI00078DA274|nr:YihY/virulence factor BrkB family protein [Variovorax sp. PAMC 28711]AMM24785.1 ribonuclease BN [Variovorax sp. PAMC 28711]
MHPKHLFDLSKKAVNAWIDDFAPSMGAAISYYTMFSLAPLLVIVIAVAGALFGREAVQGEIVAQLSGLIGRDGAIAVQGLIKSASEPSRGLIAGAISIAVLLVGATTVFAELQSALDRIWHVPEKEKPSGVWALLRARVLSFGLILGLAFLLMVSLVVSAGVAAFGSLTGGLLPGWEVVLAGVNVLVSVSITTLLFAMIFKFMPTASIEWHDVWIGAVVTAVLFEIGKTGIGLYLGKSGVNESFAAAGSLVVLLAWVYYAAQIFLLGAEFTKVYADEHGSVAGTKAVQATKVSAAVADAGTDVHAAAHAVRPATQGGAANDKGDQRVDRATADLVRQLVVLCAASLATAAVSRWQKRQRKAARASRLRR